MKYSPLLKITLFLLLLTLFFHGIVQARDILYPIGIAILLSGLLYPLVQFLEKHGFHKGLAILTAIILGILVIGGIVYLLSQQLKVFIENFDAIQSKADQNIQAIKGFLKKNVGIDFEGNESWPMSNEMMGDVLSATTGTLVKIGLQPVYVFFFLFYRDKFSEFLYRAVPDKHHETLANILDEFSLISKNYVGGLFVVVLILSVLNSIGLLIIGLKYALLLGVLSALMNFIPYFGTLIGASIPLTYALLTETPQKALYVALFFIVIQFTENNLLTPRITGGYVNINPIVTIIAIIIGGSVWGIPGMLLSVPALAVLKSISSHIDTLKPLAFLLERNKRV